MFCTLLKKLSPHKMKLIWINEWVVNQYKQNITSCFMALLEWFFQFIIIIPNKSPRISLTRHMYEKNTTVKTIVFCIVKIVMHTHCHKYEWLVDWFAFFITFCWDEYRGYWVRFLEDDIFQRNKTVEFLKMFNILDMSAVWYQTLIMTISYSTIVRQLWQKVAIFGLNKINTVTKYFFGSVQLQKLPTFTIIRLLRIRVEMTKCQ